MRSTRLKKFVIDETEEVVIVSETKEQAEVGGVEKRKSKSSKKVVRETKEEEVKVDQTREHEEDQLDKMREADVDEVEEEEVDVDETERNNLRPRKGKSRSRSRSMIPKDMKAMRRIKKQPGSMRKRKTRVTRPKMKNTRSARLNKELRAHSIQSTSTKRSMKPK